MEFAISLEFIKDATLFLITAGLMVGLILLPIGEQPISRGQKISAVVSLFVYALLFWDIIVFTFY